MRQLGLALGFALVAGCAAKASNVSVEDAPGVEAEMAAAPKTRREAPVRTDMTVEGITDIVSKLAPDLQADGNFLQFTVGEVPMAIVVDPNADRMRIVAPIAEAKDYGVDALRILLEANYHSALDARYAISDGVVYAAFIHPLSPLTKDELISGISQVANLVLTYGTSFTSTEMFFGAPGG